MKKLSLVILLLALLCCMTVLSACDTSEVCPDGHTAVTDEAVAPTCTEAGLTEGSHCSVCNTVITAQEEVPAKGHVESAWINDEQIKLTCTEDGARHKECKVCHVVLKVGKLEHTGHEYGSWESVEAATCTAEGLKKRTCELCGAEDTDVVPITHTPSSWKVGAAATCMTDGFQYRTCTKAGCGIVTATETLPAKGHSCNTYTPISSPTCTQNGARGGHCGTCGEDFVEVIDALGHRYPSTWESVAVATCSNAGQRRHACENECGTYEIETLPQLTHVKEWIVDVPATCAGNGSRHEECNLCHEVFAVETLNRVIHSESDPWTTLVVATCQQEGLEVRTCPNCTRNERRTVPKTAHAESEWIVDLVSTCHAAGSRHKSCQTCSTVLKTEVMPALDHVAGNTWIVTVAPTAAAAGSSKQICTACGDTLRTSATTLDLDATVVSALSTGHNLTTYSIVYANSCRQNTKLWSYISSVFKPALDRAAGKTTSLKSENSASDDNTKQILIGITSREESKRALSTLQGRGFTVRVDGNRIVILGTDDLLTMSALQYFINNYLAGAGKTIDIPEDVTAAGLPVVALSSAYGSSYAYIFDADWDIDPYHMYVGDSWNNQGYPGDGREYPTYVYEYFLSRISQISGLPVSGFTSVNDTVTTYQNGYEVLFATVDRAESRAFRNTLDANQYGFRIVGNKVILGAHIDAALEPMVEKFLEFYAFAMEYNGGVLPQGYEEVYTLSGTINGTILGSYTVPSWKLDFPRPANTELAMAENNNDDAIQLVYTGTGATAAGFEAYCQTLTSSGYTLVYENNNPGNTGNYFRLYKNTAKQTALYVAFDAFSYQNVYAERYKNDVDRNGKSTVEFGDFIHYAVINSGQPATQYPMRTYDQCIRIVSSSIANSYFPDTKLLTQQSYKKICNSSVTTIRYYSESVGMGYILQLEDGRFVIVDGGAGYGLCSNHPNDHQETDVLYHTLVGLYKEAHGGAEPTQSNPIHIAAWLITHSHGDHYGTMNSFLRKYAAEKLVKMDYMVGNFPEVSTIYPVAGDTVWMGSGNVANIQKYFTNAGLSTFKYVKVHTGMTLHFANLKMEILMTTEDHAPFRVTNSNDTNTVTKWTIHSTSAAANTNLSASTVSNAAKTTWTVLGDSCIYASRWLCAMWGGTYNACTDLYDNAYMAADMVQLAHHGNIGCEIALYKTVQAKVVWFSHNSNGYNSYTQDSDKSWTDTVDRYAVRECPTVQYIVVAGLNNGTTNSVTIGFNQNGINFPTSGNPAWGIKCTIANGVVTAVNYKVNIAYNTPASGKNSTHCNTSPVIKK